MLTRLGESGVDVLTTIRIAGHSGVVVSQRYVHPTPEAVKRAFERLHLSGKTAENKAIRQEVPAKFPAVEEEKSVSH